MGTSERYLQFLVEKCILKLKLSIVVVHVFAPWNGLVNGCGVHGKFD